MKNTFLSLIIILSLLACKKKHAFPRQNIKDPNFDMGELFLDKNNDSAFRYFNEVVTNSKNSLQVAMSYNYMAMIQGDAGDYFGSQESVLRSLTFLNEKNPKDFSCLFSNYNELGLSSSNLKKYDVALNYYELALPFAQNSEFKKQCLNNIALTHQKKRAYDSAIKIYQEILSKNIYNQKEYARTLSNITKTRWLQNPNYNAAPGFLKALKIREQIKDEWGKNASYSHLTDYYRIKQPDSALVYAKKMYQIAKKLISPDDQLEALQKLINLSPSTATKQYFEIYQTLADSVQTARNAAKNQFALIRYETEKNKADNLKLQKDNTEKKYQLAKQEVALFIVVLVLISSIVISVLWYKKRKQKMELQAENAIRDSQLKTSKRVHDVVANGLYRVMTEIENQEHIDKDLVLDKIEDLYEKSRDISYEDVILHEEHFNNKISALLTSFSTENTKILIAGNTPELWGKVTPLVKYEIEQIIQELMVNMKKHSSATNVALRFEEIADQVTINYTDNGIGFTNEVQKKNGLRNTGNRIDTINGAITFDTKAEKGLKIQISFPIS